MCHCEDFYMETKLNINLSLLVLSSFKSPKSVWLVLSMIVKCKKQIP